MLTIDNVHKLGNALKDLNELRKNNPDLFNTDGSKNNLDQATQRMAKYPQAVAIIRKNGLALREYVVGSITLSQAATAVAFKKAGTYKEYPPDMLKVVSPANLTFVEQHYDEISKLMSAFNGGDDKN